MICCGHTAVQYLGLPMAVIAQGHIPAYSKAGQEPRFHGHIPRKKNESGGSNFRWPSRRTHKGALHHNNFTRLPVPHKQHLRTSLL